MGLLLVNERRGSIMKNHFFKIDGTYFQHGVPIDAVIPGLKNLQKIFDNSYKVLSGKQRLTQKDRDVFRLVATDFKQGSFISNFDIVVSTMQLTLPMLGATSVNEIWPLVKNSYDFLKAVYCGAQSNPDRRVIEHHDNNSVTVNNGNQTIIYNAPVYQIAKANISGFRGLDGMLDNNRIETIQIGKDKVPEIEMKSKNKGQFDIPISVQENPEDLEGEIYNFNKYEKTGRINIFPNQAVPSETYKFKVIGDQSIDDYILSMTENKVKAKCMVELSHDPLDVTKINSLLMINVNSNF